MYSHLCSRMGSEGGLQCWTSDRKSSSFRTDFRTRSISDLSFGGWPSFGWTYLSWEGFVFCDFELVFSDLESVCCNSRVPVDDSRERMISATILRTSSGVFFSHLMSFLIRTVITWTGRTISGVLVRMEGGSSPIMIVVADVFPLPAMPNSSTLAMEVSIWP